MDILPVITPHCRLDALLQFVAGYAHSRSCSIARTGDGVIHHGWLECSLFHEGLRLQRCVDFYRLARTLHPLLAVLPLQSILATRVYLTLVYIRLVDTAVASTKVQAVFTDLCLVRLHLKDGE